MKMMDKKYEEELKTNLKKSLECGELEDRKVYLFGHCEATLTLIDMLLLHGIKPAAIMDNNKIKYGILYRDIPVKKPEVILEEKTDRVIVLIVTRFYESMNAQLRTLGFKGEVKKLVDYNTYAEYSLSENTMLRKQERLRCGENILAALRKKYPEHFFIFCPFQALGDIYFCMSYLPEFMKKRKFSKCTVCVVGKGCGAIVSLFGGYPVEVFAQGELDAAVQACLYENSEDTFVAHQDRPYVVDLSRALYLKKIPLETMYCCGVFGLPLETQPAQPEYWEEYLEKDAIEKDRSVVFSPYAKSVTPLPKKLWDSLVMDYRERGYQVFTNVCKDEKPLANTLPISPRIAELKSVVEQAGTFIGIRSGLCDVIRTADCKKIALYPDYQYCDTQWKAVDIYAIEGFENLVVKEGFEWKKH